MEKNQFFCYLRTDNPMVEWETAIGRFRSSCHRGNQSISHWTFSRYRDLAIRGLTPQLKNELRLEAVRAEHYPECVSRMTGVFLMDSPESIQDAIQRWKIQNIDNHNIVAVNFSSNNLTRADSEWITWNFSRDDGATDWMHSYWSGETYGDVPLTEILASGFGLFESGEVRARCYQSVFDKYPMFTHVLAVSAAAFHCCVVGKDENVDNFAEIYPVFMREENYTKGTYLISLGWKDKMGAGAARGWLELAKEDGHFFPMHQSAIDYLSSGIMFPDFTAFEFRVSESEVLTLHDSIHGG